jgi:transposase-like protein
MAKAINKDMGFVKGIQKVLLDDTDFLRSIVQKNLQKLLETEFDHYIQASPYERTDNRRGYRNGSYSRKLKTRVGTIELDIIRDREGNFSTELFRRYSRSEQALLLSLVEMYLQGVSTRKVKKIVETLCGISVSKSQVSSLSKQLDDVLARWRNRPLKEEYPYLVIDARYEDIRENGLVNSQAVLLVIGIRSDGKREILSIEMGDSENEEEWSRVFNKLKERGLKGVLYGVSDDHKGLVKAFKRVFQGVSWQRCQVHFMRNYMSKFSRKESKEYVLKLKDIFSAPDVEQARNRRDEVVKELEQKKPSVAQWLDEEIEYCFSVYQLPAEHRQRMRSTNMIERFNQELLRRSRVIRIFPNKESCIRLFGSMCIEQTEKWLSGSKYLDMALIKNKDNALGSFVQRRAG